MLRGDVLRLPAPRRARGHEQQGRRYGVVLQASELLALSTVIVAPTSRSSGAASFRPEIEIEGAPTRVLVEQLGAVDRLRLGDPIATLGAAAMADVDEALELVLDLSE